MKPKRITESKQYITSDTHSNIVPPTQKIRIKYVFPKTFFRNNHQLVQRKVAPSSPLASALKFRAFIQQFFGSSIAAALSASLAHFPQRFEDWTIKKIHKSSGNILPNTDNVYLNYLLDRFVS